MFLSRSCWERQDLTGLDSTGTRIEPRKILIDLEFEKAFPSEKQPLVMAVIIVNNKSIILILKGL